MKRNRWGFLWPGFWPFALMATVFWSSGTSGPSIPGAPLIPHFAKIGHFFVFGLIATLVYRALPHWLKRRVLVAVAITSIFGLSDELRQGFNPERNMAFADWLIDTMGAIVAVFAYTLWPFYRNLLETRLNLLSFRHGGRSSSQTHPGIAPEHRPAR